MAAPRVTSPAAVSADSTVTEGPTTSAPASDKMAASSRPMKKSSSTIRIRAPFSRGSRTVGSSTGPIVTRFLQRQVDRAHQTFGAELAVDRRTGNTLVYQKAAEHRTRGVTYAWPIPLL